MSIAPDRLAIIGQGTEITWEEVASTLLDTFDLRGANPAFIGGGGQKLTQLLLTTFLMGEQFSVHSTRSHPNQLIKELNLVGSDVCVYDNDAAPLTYPTEHTYTVAEIALCKANQLVASPKITASVSLFTSGSSGHPKGILLSASALTNAAQRSNLATGLTSSSRWLLSLPLFHIGGLSILTRAFVAGSTIVVPDNLNPEKLIDAAERWQVTHMSLVPTQLQDLMALARGRTILKQCDCILLGGAPPSLNLLNEANAAGLKVAVTYGMTETASHIAMGWASDPIVRSGSVGLLLPGIDVTIAPDNNAIAVASDQLFSGLSTEEQGYKDRPCGAYITADAGNINQDGYLFIHGRLDDIFISGGEKISLRSIEQVAEGIGVRECYCVPVQHPRWGTRPFLWTDTSIPLDLLVTKLKDGLSKLSLPDAIAATAMFPRLPTGKINRASLVALASSIMQGQGDPGCYLDLRVLKPHTKYAVKS